jgi:hypothetical protein
MAAAIGDSRRHLASFRTLVDHFRPENIEVCETYMDIIEGWPSMLTIPGAIETVKLYVAKLKAVPGHTREFTRAQNLLDRKIDDGGDNDDVESDLLIWGGSGNASVVYSNKREMFIVMFLMLALLILVAVSIFYSK